MTNQQIKDTISKMRATDGEKVALQKACDAGDNNSLTCVRWLFIKQNKFGRKLKEERIGK